MVFFKKYKWIFAIGGVLLLILGIYKGISTIYSTGYIAGELSSEELHRSEQDKQRIIYEQKLTELRKTNQVLTTKVAQQVTHVDAEYIKQLEQDNAQLQTTLDGVSDGTIRLYVQPETPTDSRDSGTASTPTTTEQCDATERQQLPKETARYLIRLTAEADRNTEQLKACQTLVQIYLDTVTQYNLSLAQAQSHGSLPTGK